METTASDYFQTVQDGPKFKEMFDAKLEDGIWRESGLNHVAQYHAGSTSTIIRTMFRMFQHILRLEERLAKLERGTHAEHAVSRPSNAEFRRKAS